MPAHRPRPGRLSRLLRGLPVLALLLLPLTTGPLAVAQAATGSAAGPALAAGPVAAGSPAASAEAPVQVLVTTLLPRSPRPGDYLQIRGWLQNTGDRPVSGLRVRLRIGSRIDTRGKLERADVEEPGTSPLDSTSVRPAATQLAPGARTPFDLRTRVDLLGLGASGVYPLQVEARGVAAPVDRETPVGRAATYLPWFGSQPVARTRLAWLWPVVDVPRRGPREVMLDDTLAASLGTGGRLDRLLRSARLAEKGGCATEPAPPPGAPARPRPAERARCEPAPVGYGVDPDLLFTASAMTSPYSVSVDADTSRERPASLPARGFLDSLRDAARRSPVVTLPYADPDVVALTRRDSNLAEDVLNARRLGTEVVGDVLGVTGLPSVAWPPAGRIPLLALDALLVANDSTVVLDESALPAPSGDGSRTPGTRVQLNSTPSSTGLVVEQGLSRLLEPDRATWQGPRLAEQRFLAETAIIAAARPNDSRTLLVAPSRHADVDPALAGQVLLDAGRVPWLCPVGFDEVVAHRERCPGEKGTPSYAPEPRGDLLAPNDRTAELPTDLQRDLADTRDRGQQLTEEILKPGTREAAATRARLQRAVLRAESSAWRENPAPGRQLARLVRQDVDDLIGNVRVLTSRTQLLTSSSGTLQVSIQNGLGQPVVVRVRMETANAARLDSRDELREVPARTNIPVAVRARAVTSGQFVVSALLLDREGTPFGDPAQLVVRSTRYGTAALAVTGIAAAVLLVAAGLRITRRALRGAAPRTGP